MSRLLHAAARGARIQYQINPTAPWEPIVSGWIPGFATGYYRIHPDDEHLQYGPISSVMQMWSMRTTSCDEFYIQAARAITNEAEDDWIFRYDNELHRSLFLLILAEALADEGL